MGGWRIRAGSLIRSPDASLLVGGSKVGRTFPDVYNFLYKSSLRPHEMRVVFLGDSLDDLRKFPDEARRHAGHDLELIATGRDPADWKPMTTIGPGVREIRIRDTSGAFRVIYTAALGRCVYVLHCFQKKSQKTRRSDVELAAARFRELKRTL